MTQESHRITANVTISYDPWYLVPMPTMIEVRRWRRLPLFRKVLWGCPIPDCGTAYEELDDFTMHWHQAHNPDRDFLARELASRPELRRSPMTPEGN